MVLEDCVCGFDGYADDVSVGELQGGLNFGESAQGDQASRLRSDDDVGYGILV